MGTVLIGRMLKLVFLLVSVLALFVSEMSQALLGDTDVVANNAAEKPNIIFILIDDLGWGDLGVFHQNNSKHDRKHSCSLTRKTGFVFASISVHWETSR